MKFWFSILLVLSSICASGQVEVFYFEAKDLLGEVAPADSSYEPIVSGEPLNLSASNSNHYLKIPGLKVVSKSTEFLVLDNPILDSVFYSSQFSELESSYLAESDPIGGRPLRFPGYLIPVERDIESVTYLRIKTGESVVLNIDVQSTDHLQAVTLDRNLIFGLYTGLILALLFYNLFVGLSVRDKVYYYYAGYIAFVGLSQLTFHGYANYFIQPLGGWLHFRSLYIFGALSGLFTLLFVRSFLSVPQNAPRIDLVFKGIIAIQLLAIVFAFSGLFPLSYTLIDATAGLGSFLVLGLSVYLVRKKVPNARFFLIAWTIFLLAVIVFVMKDLGVIAETALTKNALVIGSGIEMVLLSFALAFRINILTAEKKRSQSRALEALKENERIIREQNEILEVKVTERTKELEKSNLELNEAYSDLKNTQIQLVEAEKMASLGQMTAGIAHELNNPINYVSSNINPLRRDVDEVFHILDTVETELPTMEAESRERIDQLKRQIDLPFVREEIANLLNGIEDGASRSAAIVKGLRIFSRLDEDTLKMANVNDGLESTLIILKSNYKDECAVNKDLDSSLPLMECYPGKLNQVFMNILTNAIQATKQSDKPKGERLVNVRSAVVKDEIEIVIQDNGLGMEESVRQRIFEPFFTTKKVGEGTGLGLSIVIGIVEQHGGSIHVDSKPGVGTSFRINLPLRNSNGQPTADGQ